MLARLCHSDCNSCFGPLATECYDCASAVPYKSGVNCGVDCADGYGIPPADFECIVCDTLCKSCFSTFDNCTECWESGANESYLLMDSGGTAECVVNCPTDNTVIENSTTHICDPCESPCLTCENTTTSCLSCEPGYSLSGNVCTISCIQG